MTPVPSRSWGKQILPERRRLYSHPGMLTVSPTCLPASATVILRAAVSTLMWRFQAFQFLENIPDHGQRVLCRHSLQFQKQRVLVHARAQQLHCFGPVDGAAFRGQGEE